MNEEVFYTVSKTELLSWQKHIREGLEPVVPFKMDNNEMLTAAYTLRGDMLYFMHHRLVTIMEFGGKKEEPKCA